MNSIIQRLQSHTVSIYHLSDEILEEQIIDARSLLVPSRFDLFAKLYYIRNRTENLIEAERIYKEHIKAFNPDLKEPGREDKNGMDDFVSSFNQLIDEFENQDFNSAISLVPVTEDGVILDGAHRIAVLAYYDKQVGIARCKGIKPKARFDYNYFKERGLSWDTMDVIAREMVYWVPDMFVACLLPPIKDKYNALVLIQQRFRVVYEKVLWGNIDSYRSWIRCVCDRQTWVNKLDNVKNFDFDGKMLFLFFVANSPDEFLAVREDIFDKCDLGKYSLYITESIDETKVITEGVLNEKVRRQLSPTSIVNKLKETIEERWYYMKHVQLINAKVAIAKVLDW